MTFTTAADYDGTNYWFSTVTYSAIGSTTVPTDYLANITWVPAA